MKNKNLFYNVNEIIVRPGLESSYIDFSKELNSYLLKEYSRYYAGLQLYQDNSISNVFHVIASYYDVPGVYKVAPLIGDNISCIYDKVWGSSVERNSLFSFLNSNRIF
jgi:hypothetical protein